MDITNDRDDDYYDPLLSSFFAQAMIDSPPARQFSPFTVTPAFLTDSSSSSYQQLPACIDHYFAVYFTPVIETRFHSEV